MLLPASMNDAQAGEADVYGSTFTAEHPDAIAWAPSPLDLLTSDTVTFWLARQLKELVKATLIGTSLSSQMSTWLAAWL